MPFAKFVDPPLCRMLRAMVGAIGLLGAPTSAVALTLITNSAVTSNTVWGPTGSPPDSEYVVTVDVTVSNNARLTIQPGTTVRFRLGRMLQIASTSAGSLTAEGTPASPIRFLGEVETPGHWDGLRFTNLSDAAGASSLLDHCLIAHGGAAGTGALVLCESTTAPTIRNTILEYSSQMGIALLGSTISVEGCTFRHLNRWPFSAPPAVIGIIVASNSFEPSPSAAFNAFVVQGGTVSQSTLWPCPPVPFTYLVDPGDDILIEGAANPILTIAAGSIIKSSGTTFFRVGSGAPGGLIATGVTFTSSRDDTLGDGNGDGSTVPNAGDWESLVFSGNTLDAQSQLEDCLLRYGAGSDAWRGALDVDNAGPTIVSCRFDRNARNHLRIQGGAPSLLVEDCVFTNHDWAPVEAHPSWITRVLDPTRNNDFVARADGSRNVFRLSSGTVAQSITWLCPPVPFTYLVDPGDDILIEGAANPILTIAAGSIIKSSGTTFFRVGSGAPGGLIATGVTFTSSRDDTLGDGNGDGSTVPNAGDWESLVFSGNTLDAQSQLEDCLLRYGAGSDAWRGALDVDNAGPTIVSCRFDRNARNHLRIQGGAPSLLVEDCVFTNHDWAPVEAPVPWLGSAMAAAHRNTFVPRSDGRRNVFRIRGGAVANSVTLEVPPVPFTYLVDAGDDIDIGGAGAPILTLQPGTIVKMSGNTYILVGSSQPGGLVADRVVFTSALDDTLGDATANGATIPHAGDWESLVFRNFSIDLFSRLTDCVVRYGGNYSGFGGMVSATDASISIEGCVVSESRFDGIYLAGANAGPRVHSTTVRKCVRGVTCTTGPSTTVNYCNLVNNSVAGLDNDGLTTINAELNWWGAADGPSGEGPGSGEAVYGPVDYIPWLAAPEGKDAEFCWPYPLSYVDFDGVDHSRTAMTDVTIGLYAADAATATLQACCPGSSCWSMPESMFELGGEGCEFGQASLEFNGADESCNETFFRQIPFQLTMSGMSYPASHLVVADEPLLQEGDLGLPGWGEFGDLDGLLRHFAPVLKFQAGEKYFPVRVDVSLHDAVLRTDGPGAPSGAPDFLQTGLRPETLSRYSWPFFWVDLPCDPNIPDGCQIAYSNALAATSNPHVVYATGLRDPGRDRVRSSDDLIVLQYWMNYYFNDWDTEECRTGIDIRLSHEGDWEHVTIALSLSLHPISVAFGGHGAETVHWTLVETYFDTDHPVAYVGKGGHASYAKPGTDCINFLKEYHEGDGTIFVPPGVGGFGTLYSVERLPRWADLRDREDPNRWIEYSGYWGVGDPHLMESPTSIFPGEEVWRGPAFRLEWPNPSGELFEDLEFIARSSGDIKVTDPWGRVVGPDSTTIPFARYEIVGESPGIPGSRSPRVKIPFPVAGEYRVESLTAGSRAADEVFSLLSRTNWTGRATDVDVIAEDIPVEDIPPGGYQVVPSVPAVGHSEVIPDYWNADWDSSDTTPVEWRLTAPDGSFQVSDLDLESLRLNETVTPIMPVIVDGETLIARFPRGAAVRSIEGPGPYHEERITLTGSFADSILYLEASTLVRILTAAETEGQQSAAAGFRVVFPHGNNLADYGVDLRLDLPARGRLQVSVFDVAGRRLRELADSEFESGSHALRWDGRSMLGHRVPAGIYFVSATFGDERLTSRLLVVR